MGTVLWIIQAILCLKLISVAYTHGLRKENAEMLQARQKMGNAARPLLLLAALWMFIGGLSQVLPLVRLDLVWLVPWGAAFLAVLMFMSIGLRLVGREKPKIWADLILLALAAFIAYVRWVLVPL
jgi:VIT1/CCC1 family predicted Fe2+/Mn2+ transporter